MSTVERSHQPPSFNVLAARLNKGLTQRELAAACDVSLTVVQRLEGGESASPRNAKKVADFFAVLVTDLMPIATQTRVDEPAAVPSEASAGDVS